MNNIGKDGMSDGMLDGINKTEEEIDKILAPERLIKWSVRILVLVGSIGAVYVSGKLAYKFIAKADREAEVLVIEKTVDNAWYSSQLDKILAAKAREVSLLEALQRHREEVATRFISRESDRLRTISLENAIVTTQEEKAALIQEYNKNAMVVKPIGFPERVE